MHSEAPPKPSELDCCNSGCNPCILDVYEEQLRLFNIKALKTALVANNCICPSAYSSFEVVNIAAHTHDTRLYTFKYVGNCNDFVLQYKAGQHFLLKGSDVHDKEDQFTRAYTPISLNSVDNCTFTIIVKLYEHGKMSQFLKTLKLQNETLWRGPYGSFDKNSTTYSHMLLIAQGTGIAPIFSVIKDFLNDRDCDSFLKLFFCCRTERDILLRQELYELCSHWNFTYEVFLTKGGTLAFEVKYNEVIHYKRLDLTSVALYVNDKLNSMGVLICGSEAFNESMLWVVLDCNVVRNRIFLF